jgi:hypothetical protein
LSSLLAATCILWLTSPVQARMSRACSYRQNASVELRCGHANLWHATSLGRFLRAHPYAGTRFTRASLWRDAGWLYRYAKRHIAHAQQRMAPPVPSISYSAWNCIHSHEGSWTDSGDPYWGGLQMDRGFMYTYGRDMIRRFGGFANVWPVWAQMAVAQRAHDSGRGYYPWPNTARMCGLL